MDLSGASSWLLSSPVVWLFAALIGFALGTARRSEHTVAPAPAQDLATDESYADAAHRAVGRSLSALFRALVDGGMNRNEALRVVLIWTSAHVSVMPESEGRR